MICRVATQKTPKVQVRRWMRNHLYRWKRDVQAMLWHCETFWGAEQIWGIYHYYQHGWVTDGYVRGRGNPENILAYLEFLAQRKLKENCGLTNQGAVQMLTQFYNYRQTPFQKKKSATYVDLYELCEQRCGRRLHNALGRLLYWRPGLVKELLNCVELE